MKQPVTALLLVLALSACLPFQDAATGAANELVGDEAQLEPRSKALIFFPLGTVTDTLLDIQGVGLTSLDPADNCTGDPTHIQCALGEISEAATVEITGSGLSAVVSYRRFGVWRLEALTVPQ